MRFSAAIIASVVASLVVAHPGADLKQELRERQEFIANSKRTNLGHCASKHKARGIEKAAIARRQSLAAKNAKRGMVQRDPTDINKSHLSDADFDNTTPLADVFAQNASCVLSPEETEGPYCKIKHYPKTAVPSINSFMCRRLWRVCPHGHQRSTGGCSPLPRCRHLRCRDVRAPPGPVV